MHASTASTSGRRPRPAAAQRFHARASGLFAGSALLLALVAGACTSSAPVEADGDKPTVVVTTSVLGDVVSDVVGDSAQVVVLIGRGADPHEAQPSAQQVQSIQRAAAIVANGGGLEAGFDSAVSTAEADGVPVVRALELIDPLPAGSGGGHDHDHPEEEDDHAGEQHADEEHAEGEVDHDHAEGEADHESEAGHDHAEGEADHAEGEAAAEDDHEGHGHDGDDDPHFATDPARMAVAVAGIAEHLAEVEALDADVITARAADVIADLEELDAEVEAILDVVPDDRRLLVTYHESLGYFADRYGFDIVGVVVAGGGTGAEPNAAALHDLAEEVADRGVTAAFSDPSPASAAAIESALGDQVEVVELPTESLGEEGSESGTYAGLVRTIAQRIADALG